MKETVAKKMDSAYSLLSRVQVCGENVDLLAMARQELREAFRLLNELKEEEQDNG